jgi:hypothetical protein
MLEARVIRANRDSQEYQALALRAPRECPVIQETTDFVAVTG